MTNKKQPAIIIGILAVVLAGFVFFYMKNQQKEPVSATSFKLNTIVKVTIYDSQDESFLQEVMDLCDQYEKVFSRTLAESELYRLNRQELPSEDGKTFDISPELAELTAKGLEYSKISKGAFDITVAPVSSLWDFTSGAKKIPAKTEIEEALPLTAKGLEYSKISKGAFDITVAPVSSLWDFTSGAKKIPAKTEIEEALPLVNYKNVELSDARIRFEKQGMGLDLGAIAKGYIADKMKEFLISKGVKSAIIDLGGNVLCVGKRPDNKPFRIGIQRPFAGRSETVATVEIEDKSVVSSGIYERYFEKNGTLYHHILNPKTGYPYENDLVSVTIISDKSVDGDGLSTSCFALGLEEGMALVESLDGIHAVFITADGKLHLTKGLEEELELIYTE